MPLDFGGLGSGISSLFGAVGDLQSAKGYKKAAAQADLSAQLSEQSTQIQITQQQRELYKTLGSQQADIGGAGLANSGSALDLVRSSAAQGSLAKQLIGLQGEITKSGYEAEAASYRQMASASKKSALGGAIGGAIKIAGAFAMFSDDRLKENVRLVRRRQDGIGIYSYRFKGDQTWFEGLLASDVLAVRPDAVAVDLATGLYKVDYDALGVEPRILED